MRLKRWAMVATVIYLVGGWAAAFFVAVPPELFTLWLVGGMVLLMAGIKDTGPSE